MCDSRAGHLRIPQGEAGKQSLLWVFLDILEKCVFFEDHDPIAIDSTVWSCSLIYILRCISSYLAFHVSEMEKSKYP